MPWKNRIATWFPAQQSLPWREQANIALASGVCVCLIWLISHYGFGLQGGPLLLSSMGASAVLLFGLPGSPVSQPWPLLGGHVLSAAIGIACARHVPQPAIAAGLALFLSMLTMLGLRCFHPPGGAITLFAVLGGPPVQELGFGLLWQPLAINLLLMFVLGYLFNNQFLRRPWPAPKSTPNPHRSRDSNPLARLGLNQDDIQASVRQFGALLDVSPADLATLFRGAQLHAAERRLGEIRCADIMSRNIFSVEFGTPLAEAWRLLYTHKVNALPVLDRFGHVIGIVTLIDFLKAAQLNQPDNLRRRMREFLAPSGKSHSEKAEVVGQIMTAKVLTAQEQMHIVNLIDLLSDRGMHHVPIVNAENRLCGMVTQSDLIAALFHGGAQQGGLVGDAGRFPENRGK